MDISYWTNLNLNHSYKQTNKLFFDQYQYGASGLLHEVNTLRGLDFEDFYENITHKEMFKHHSKYISIRTFPCNSRYNLIKKLHKEQITTESKENLKNFLTLLLESQSVGIDFKLSLKVHSFYCYSNDINFLTKLLQHPGVIHPNITEIKLAGNNNTLVRKNSLYSLRTYLHKRMISAKTKNQLQTFVNTYESDINVSKSFNRWLRFSGKYCNDHFFFDYNDPGLKLIFEMMVPGLTRKTYNIINEE